MDTASASSEALEAACQPFDGQAPDAVITCAGSSKPMFFVETEERDMVNGMTNAYWVQAWTAWAAAKKMAKQKRKGAKIVMVSSTLGYISFLGWASYSPGKHALRGMLYCLNMGEWVQPLVLGLADTLHSEMLLYGVDVHIFFPNTMYTDGYEEENKTKPSITKKIEEGDDGITADQAAAFLFKGLQRGQVHITCDLITSLFSASTRGGTPRNSWLLDGLLDFVAYVCSFLAYFCKPAADVRCSLRCLSGECLWRNRLFSIGKNTSIIWLRRDSTRLFLPRNLLFFSQDWKTV